MASSKKVVSDFLDCMPAEIYDTLINEQIFGNVPEDLNQLPTSAVIGYVTIKDCVKGEYLSEWGGPEFQWVVEEAYLFDEPQLVGIKAKLKLFDVPEIDENNLPPAHKVKLKGMRLDGDTLNISITDKCLDEVLENGELRLGFYAKNVCYELEDENGLREFKHVAFKSPTRNITMEKKDFKALCYMEDEEVKQVPSVLYGDQVDWNFYSIEVGNVEENSQAKETTQEEEPGTTVKGEIIMVPEERFYVLKCALLSGELNCDVKVGDPVTVTFDDGYTGGEQSYEIVNANPRPRLLLGAPADNPSSQLTFYRFYMKPYLLISPSVISRAEADGARISFWCNLANVTRRFVRTAAREFYLNFCWPSDAEIIAADEELEDELEAEEEVEIEVVYECPQGECSGWLTIDEWHPVNPHEPPQREDASVYSGPAWQTAYTNGSLVCWLTVATADGSTEAHEGTGAVVLDEGQYAEVSVYMATTEYGGDIYDDEVEWQVLVNGTAAMSGSASVSSGVFGSPLATQRFDPPADGTLRLRLVGRARNVADGLRQSCVRIVVRVIDEVDAPAQP